MEIPQRLDQMLTRCGYCSRREARGWVRSGRVTVAGRPADSPAQKVPPGDVLVDGAPLEQPAGLLAMLHKPAGYVCSRDEREGPNIYELLPERWSLRHPPVASIGRLDKDATGLLLITDQGELVHEWTSPKRKVAKVYEVEVDKPLRPELVALFASGTLRLDGEDKPCAPARLELTGPATARLELTEGRFHQVRRMFADQGWLVIRLHRPSFGAYSLGELPSGQWRMLDLPPQP